jgi:hypothetical protein
MSSKFFTCFLHLNGGRVSTIVIATRFGLDGPGIESRWVARLSVPVYTDPVAVQYPLQLLQGISLG